MPKGIMTADDSTSIRQMVGFTLKQTGDDVLEAVDGLELIKQVRSMSQFKFMPIIMLTTESQADMKQQGKAASATGWIVKPFKPEQLIAVIKKVLR